MRWAEGPVRVRVPATSANLGPGYDTLGLALALYDEVEARVTSPSSSSSSPLSLSVTGEGAEDVAGAGEKHLVVRAMRAAFDELGCGQPPGIELRCVNRIPHGRGLGSSAAAITAGILAARSLAGAPAGPRDALPLATAMEGHPDNVAPCLYGGLTIAWLSDAAPADAASAGTALAGALGAKAGAAGRPVAQTARAVRLMPLPEVRPVVLIAPAPVSTEVARGLLPDKVTHADAVGNAGRAALLIAALTARPDALFDATEDRLHQDYRASAMPATADLVRRLRAAGIPAVVSGAGPSVLAFLVSGRATGRVSGRVSGRASGQVSDRAPGLVSGDPSGAYHDISGDPGRPYAEISGTANDRSGTANYRSSVANDSSSTSSDLSGRPGDSAGPGDPSVNDVPRGSGDDLDKLDSTAQETGIDWRISPLDIERQGASVTCGFPDVPVVR